MKKLVKKHKLWIILGLIVLAGVLVFYFFGDTSQTIMAVQPSAGQGGFATS